MPVIPAHGRSGTQDSLTYIPGSELTWATGDLVTKQNSKLLAFAPEQFNFPEGLEVDILFIQFYSNLFT